MVTNQPVSAHPAHRPRGCLDTSVASEKTGQSKLAASDWLLVALALPALDIKADEPLSNQRLRVVLRMTRATSSTYGVGERAARVYDPEAAILEIDRDLEHLSSQRLVEPRVQRVRKRAPDGAATYSEKSLGYSPTHEGLDHATSLLGRLEAETVSDMRSGHEQAATDLLHLRQFALVTNALGKLKPLKEMAQQEDWWYRHSTTIEPYPILSSYLSFTFQRCRDQDKLATNKWNGRSRCIFNTGLFTPNLERIFGVFEEARTQARQGQKSLPWVFRGFARESDPVVRSFRGDPPAAHATYLEKASDLVYDEGRRFTIDYDHLLDDHLDRFPVDMQGLDKHSGELRRARLERAIHHARMKLEQNYRTAIPQFYWPNSASDHSRVQLLLPLYLAGGETSAPADLALVVDPHPSESSYTAATAIPLDWAFKNARLLARLDRDWLDP